MNILKISIPAALCFFSTGMFGQDQQPDIKQLDHDIMIWNARNDVVNNINSLSLKVLAASAVLAACAGGGLHYLHENNYGHGSYISFSNILVCSSFGGLCLSYVAAHLSAGIWSINLLLLLYTKCHLAALKEMKERLLKTQKIA